MILKANIVFTVQLYLLRRLYKLTHNSKGDDLSQAFSGQDQCPSTSNTVWDTIVTVNFL